MPPRRRNPTIRLTGFGKPKTLSPAVEAFLRAFFDASYPSPFSPNERTERALSGIDAVVEITPQYAGVHIDEVRALTKKQGEGTKAVRFLTDLADQHGVELYLYAKPFGNEAMDLDTLVRFYRRHGFREMEEEDEDGEGVEMVRRPRRQNPARKAKPPALAEAGLPEVWFHGTQKAFGKLKAQGGACIWLADKAGAMAYATPHYGRRSAIRLIEITLAPDTRVVDLANANDPIVREFIRLDASASNMRWHGRETVTDAELVAAIARWNAAGKHYGVIEARAWSKAYFRKAGADALLVRDVRGWGGHEEMPSLCLLNPKKVVSERDVTPDLSLVPPEDMPKYENPSRRRR